MSDRITNNQMHRSMLRNINGAHRQMMETQEQLSSGYKLSKPSDNPLKATQTMSLLTQNDGLKQYQSNLQHAHSWTDVADTSLSQVSDLLVRARSLITQASNDTYSTSERLKVASELGGILESIKAQANTKVGDEFIFAGTATLTQPYTAGPSDAYAGNAGQVLREIAPGVRVPINELGSAVFGDNTTGMLRNLRDAIANMTSGTPADIQTLRTTNLAGLSTSIDDVTTARARIGELQNRFEFNLDRIMILQDNNGELLANVRDTDYAEATMEYMRRQASFEAALKTGQDIVAPSLVDFLK